MLGFFLSSPLPARRAPTEPARGVEPLLALSLSTVTMSAACVNGEDFPFDWVETPGFRHAPRPALYSTRQHTELLATRPRPLSQRCAGEGYSIRIANSVPGVPSTNDTGPSPPFGPTTITTCPLWTLRAA